MQSPAPRHWFVIVALASAALLGACNDDGTASSASAPAASTKAACGNAAVATATLHCPPGYTAPKS